MLSNYAISRQDEEKSEGRLSSSSDFDDRSRNNSDENNIGEGVKVTGTTAGTQSQGRHRELIVPNSEADSPFATYVLHTRQNTLDSGEMESCSGRRGVRLAQQHTRQTMEWQEATLDLSSTPSSSSVIASLDTPIGYAFAEAWRRGLECSATSSAAVQSESDFINDQDMRSPGSGSSSAKDAGSGSGAGMTREDSVVSSASSLAASHLSDVIQLMASQPLAENLLTILGYNDTSSFLPRRFVNNWFEKVSLAHQVFASRRDDPSSEEGSASGWSSPVTSGLESLHRVALLHRDADVTSGVQATRRLAHSSTVTGPLRRPDSVHKAAIGMSDQEFLVGLQHVINRQAIMLQAVEPVEGRRQGFASKRQVSLPADLDALHDENDMKALHEYHVSDVESKSNRTQEFFDRELQRHVTETASRDKETAEAGVTSVEVKNKSTDTSEMSTSSGPAALSTPHSGSSRTSADIESDLEKFGSDSGSGNTKSSSKTPPNVPSRAMQLRRSGTIPTIIVNSVSLDQHSLSSIEIAEIFEAPPGEGSAYVTGDREGQDDRSSLGVTTASDNSEALLAPFLNPSASPATVSPVTVIEMDKLDNCHDSMDSEVNDPMPQSSDDSNDYSVHVPINPPMTSSGGGPFLLCRPPSSTVDLYDEDDYLRPVCRHVISTHMPAADSSSSNRPSAHSCSYCPTDDSSRSSSVLEPSSSSSSSRAPSYSCSTYDVSSSREAGVQQVDGTLSPIRRIVTGRAHTMRVMDVGVQCSIHFTSVSCQATVESVPNSTQTQVLTVAAQPSHPDVAMVTRCNDPHCNIHRILTRCIEDMLDGVVGAVGRTAVQHHHTRHTEDNRHAPDVSHSQSQSHATNFNTHRDFGDSNRSHRAVATSMSFDSSLQQRDRNRATGSENRSKSGRSEADRRKYTAIDDDDNEDDDVGYHDRHQSNRKGATLNRYNSLHNGFGLETIVSVESERSSQSDSDVKQIHHNLRRMPRQMTSSVMSVNSDWSMPVTQSRRSSITTVSDMMKKQKSFASFDDDTCSNLDSHWTNLTSSESKTSRSFESGQSARKGLGQGVHEGEHAGGFPVRAWSTVAGGERHATKSTERQKRSFDSVQTQPVKLRAKVKDRNTGSLQLKTRAVSDLRSLRPADALNKVKIKMNEAMLEQKIQEDAAEEMSENESDDYCYYSNRTNDSAMSSGGYRSVTSQTEDNISTLQHGGRLSERREHGYHGNMFNTDFTLQARAQSYSSKRKLQVRAPVYNHHGNHRISPHSHGLSPSAYKRTTRAGYYTDPTISHCRKLPNTPTGFETQPSERRLNSNHGNYSMTSRAHLPRLQPNRQRQQLLLERDHLLAEIDNVLKYGLQHANTGSMYHYGNYGDIRPGHDYAAQGQSYQRKPSRHHQGHMNEGRLHEVKDKQHVKNQHWTEDNVTSFDNRADRQVTGVTVGDDRRQTRAKYKRRQFWQQVTADRMSASTRDANAGMRPTNFTAQQSLGAFSTLNRQESADYKTLVKGKGSLGDYSNLIIHEENGVTDHRGGYDEVPTIGLADEDDYCNSSRGVSSPIRDELCQETGGEELNKQQTKDSNASADSGEDYLPLMNSNVPLQRQLETVSSGTTVKKRHLYSTYHSEDMGDVKTLSNEIAADDLAEAILAQAVTKSSDMVTDLESTETRLKRTESKTKRLLSMHSQSIQDLPQQTFAGDPFRGRSTEKMSSDDETAKYKTVLSKSSTFSQSSSVDSNYLQVLAESDADSHYNNNNNNNNNNTNNNSGRFPQNKQLPSSTSAFHEHIPSRARTESDYDNCMQIVQEYKSERGLGQGHALTALNVASITATKTKLLPDTKRQFLDIARPNNDSTSSEDSMQNYLRLIPNSEEDDLNEKRHKIFDVQNSKVYNGVKPRPSVALSTETLRARSASEESAEDYLQIVEHMIGEGPGEGHRRGNIEQLVAEQPIFAATDDTDNTDETVAHAQRLSGNVIASDDVKGRGGGEGGGGGGDREESDGSDDSAPDYLQVLRDSDGDSTGSRRYGVKIKVTDRHQGYYADSVPMPARDYPLTVKRDSQDSVTSDDDSAPDYLQVMPNSDEEERARHYFLARQLADSYRQDSAHRMDTGNDERLSTEDAESSDTHSISEAEYRLQGNYSDEECRSRHNSSADQDRRSISLSTKHGSLSGSRPPKDRLNNIRQPSKLPRPLRYTSLPAASRSNIRHLIGNKDTSETDVSNTRD